MYYVSECATHCADWIMAVGKSHNRWGPSSKMYPQRSKSHNCKPIWPIQLDLGPLAWAPFA